MSEKSRTIVHFGKLTQGENSRAVILCNQRASDSGRGKNLSIKLDGITCKKCLKKIAKIEEEYIWDGDTEHLVCENGKEFYTGYLNIGGAQIRHSSGFENGHPMNATTSITVKVMGVRINTEIDDEFMDGDERYRKFLTRDYAQSRSWGRMFISCKRYFKLFELSYRWHLPLPLSEEYWVKNESKNLPSHRDWVPYTCGPPSQNQGASNKVITYHDRALGILTSIKIDTIGEIKNTHAHIRYMDSWSPHDNEVLTI